MSLSKKIISGSLWSLLGSLSYQLSGLIIFIILSRILSPVDFGTAALAIVFVELSNTIVRYGLIEVIVRNTEQNDVENDVFIATLILGLLSGAILFLGAYNLEFLFDAPGLAISLKILSVVPIMQALSTTPEGLLRREFKFKALAFRLFFSSVFAGLVAIYLAYNNYGFYSLIVQKIIATSVALALVWNRLSWRPKPILSFSKFISVLKQGQPIVLSSLVGQGVFRFVELIVGFFLGVIALGQLKIAGKLLDVIVQFTIKPIVDVSFSAFSTLKNDPIELQRCFTNFITITALFSLPIFVGGYVIGNEMIYLIFGEKWSESGVIFSILCLSGLSASFNYFFAPLCHSTHNSHIPFKLRVIEFLIVVTLVSIFSQYSIYYVAYSNVLTATILSISMLIILKIKFAFSTPLIIKALLPSVISSIIMGGVVFIVLRFILAGSNLNLKLILSIVVGCISYFLVYKIIFPERTFELVTEIKKLINR